MTAITPRSIALRGAREGATGYCFENKLIEHISNQLRDLILIDADDNRNIYEINTKALRDFAHANFPEKLKPHVTQEEHADLVQKEMLQDIQYFGNRYWQPPVMTGAPADIDHFRVFFDTSLKNEKGTPKLSGSGPAYWWEMRPNYAMSWYEAKTLQACRLQTIHYHRLEQRLACSNEIGDYELECVFGKEYFDALEQRMGREQAKQAILFHLFHALKRRGLSVKAKKQLYQHVKETGPITNKSYPYRVYTDDLSQIYSLEVQL